MILAWAEQSRALDKHPPFYPGIESYDNVVSFFLLFFSKYEKVDEHPGPESAGKPLSCSIVFALRLGICWGKKHL